jgi:metal-responsive CopG/Arc/MetJ family transcriptional regulator
MRTNNIKYDKIIGIVDISYFVRKRKPMRLTIDDYAKRFELPVATIHSKLRAKELDYAIENGKVYILSEESMQHRQKTSVGTIIALYQKENQHLKTRITELENKIDRLIHDKEQMLREERDRIEHLYQSKDEQLKTILELVNTKLQLSQSAPITAVREQIENSVDADLEESEPAEISKQAKRGGTTPLQKLSLRKYLKNTELEADEKRIIRRRFAAAYGSDIRVLHHNGEFYLDLSKFDYSDLLKV